MSTCYKMKCVFSKLFKTNLFGVMTGLKIDHLGLQVSVSSAMDGTSSALIGGSFANGAITGAFTTIFNHMQHYGDDTPETSQNKKYNEEYYYESVDGMTFNDGTIVSRDDFVFTFNDDPLGNARFMGMKEGKYCINFDIGDYEITSDNIRVLVIHEAYGHGKMGYNATTTHHLAYKASIDSKYWNKTTLKFKRHNLKHFWNSYTTETGLDYLPSKYYNEYMKHLGQ